MPSTLISSTCLIFFFSPHPSLAFAGAVKAGPSRPIERVAATNCFFINFSLECIALPDWAIQRKERIPQGAYSRSITGWRMNNVLLVKSCCSSVKEGNHYRQDTFTLQKGRNY